MNCWLENEPHLDDVLADPIVSAVMARDGVERDGLRRLLDEVGRSLRHSPPQSREKPPKSLERLAVDHW